MNQPTTPNTVEDFLPLPTSFATAKRLDGTYCPAYTADQVRAAILADRARLAPAAPSEVEAARLREIARLIGAIFVYGNFKAETQNERQLEKLLRDQGAFFDTVAQYEAKNKQEESK